MRIAPLPSDASSMIAVYPALAIILSASIRYLFIVAVSGLVITVIFRFPVGLSCRGAALSMTSGISVTAAVTL